MIYPAHERLSGCTVGARSKAEAMLILEWILWKLGRNFLLDAVVRKCEVTAVVYFEIIIVIECFTL